MADPAEADDEGPDVPETATPAAGTGVPAPPAVPAGGAAPTTLPAPSIDSMVTTPEQMEKTRAQLLAIQKAKMASQYADRAEMTSRLDRDRARMEQAYKASAAEPAGLTPWDANKKSAEHYTDPVTAFGSIGSVFAMLASSFAGLPMEAGLNAGAAAINAIHQGDAKAYDRHFESWKENNNLAFKRHEIQRQAYNDATNLMNSNINAGRTKMEMAAAKFGDQKVQALLENGMDKELTDLFVARNKSAAEMQDSWDKIQLQHDKVTDLRSDPRYTSGDPQQKAEAITEWTTRWAPNSSQKLRWDAESDYMKRWDKENPSAGLEDRTAALMKFKTGYATAGAGNDINDELMAKFNEEHAGDHDGAGPTADEQAAYLQKLRQKSGVAGGGGGGPLSSGKLKTQAIQEIVEASKKEVEAGTRTAPKTLAEATAEYNRGVATPSGNRLDDIDKAINMYENGTQAIDRTLALIDKHVGAVGAPGYATRLAERLGNVVGSNETDRVQLAHDIEYLQTIAPRLMQDASSRGLKAEADKVNSMMAGLKIGDTTANTKRALTEVKQLWAKMQQDSINRRRGSPSPTSGAGPATGTPGASPAKPPAAGKMPWQKDPIVAPAGPRADVGTSGATDFSARRRIPGETGPEEGQSYKAAELPQRIQEAIDAAEASGQKMSGDEIVAMVKGLIGTQGKRLLETTRAP